MAKITTFEAENIKRIKAVQFDCSGNALTVVGGKNDQGKTSVIDAICWVLGGDRFKPSNPNRKESVIPGNIRIQLDNKLIAERKGKNGSLTVTDPEGRSAGQALLNKFISIFALNMPKFINSNDKDKAKILLQIIGIGEELEALDEEEKKLVDERLIHGRHSDSRKKYADELPYYSDQPEELISVSKQLERHKAILLKNAENQKLRDSVSQLKTDIEQSDVSIFNTEQELIRIQKVLSEAKQSKEQLELKLFTAEKSTKDLQDESTEEIENSIRDIEETNKQINANIEKTKALQESETLIEQYNELTAKIEGVREEKTELLNGVDLPLPGLSVADGALIYNGKKWDCMSGSQQLKVSAAIVRKLNPECEFVLMDKMEQFDLETLQEFAEWCESENLQVIGTRVSTGDECSIIIEDGVSKEWTGAKKKAKPPVSNSPHFNDGEF